MPNCPSRGKDVHAYMDPRWRRILPAKASARCDRGSAHERKYDKPSEAGVEHGLRPGEPPIADGEAAGANRHLGHCQQKDEGVAMRKACRFERTRGWASVSKFLNSADH